jgi:hypothetical protein
MLGKDSVEYARTHACCDANEGFKMVWRRTCSYKSRALQAQKRRFVRALLAVWLARQAREEQHQPTVWKRSTAAFVRARAGGDVRRVVPQP